MLICHSSMRHTGVLYFLVSIASNSCATIRQLKDWKACQDDGQKVCSLGRSSNFDSYLDFQENYIL